MPQTATKKVEYTESNVQKCMCGQCPVQANSSCVADLSQKMQETRQTGELPEPKQLPGLYCGTGTSACNDLNAQAQCVCPTCAVWKDHELSNYKYCMNGSAQQIG